MDTKHLETVAEDLISHELQHAGMLVAKPKFDREGTDLLAFLDMGDGVKFCRVQCKGRSLIGSRSQQVVIPSSYVTNGLVLILYVDTGDPTKRLYCFFATDIQEWRKTSKNEYKLSLVRSNFESKLKLNFFDNAKIRLIELLIRSAETWGEFKSLVYGQAKITLGPFRFAATAESTGGEQPEPPRDGESGRRHS